MYKKQNQIQRVNLAYNNSCRGAQRRAYWKQRANSPDALNMYGERNISLMKLGKAPIGANGHKMVLHHVEGIKNNFNFVVEMTRTDHILFHQTFGYKNFISVFDTNIPFFYAGGQHDKY